MKITLSTTNLKELHEGNPMMMSYNVEFAEVTGGTFWKGYTEAQIAGTEPFSGLAYQRIAHGCHHPDLG